MKQNEIKKKLKESGYYANKEICFAVAAAEMGIPIIVTGAPGTGKTSLAYATAKAFDLPLIRIQFYEGLTDDKILYDYNYQKQLLTLEAIKPMLEKAYGNEEDIGTILRKASEDINFYGEEFLIERPVLKAINGDRRKVLLLDEIDKADEAIEYTLLEVLDDYSMSIPQFGRIECPADQRPIVFLTSNESRNLSDALKRRCGYLKIEDKSKSELEEIIITKAAVDFRLAEKISECIVRARNYELNQMPSIAEGIQWGMFLKENYSKEAAKGSLGLLVKNARDKELIKPVVDNVFSN